MSVPSAPSAFAAIADPPLAIGDIQGCQACLERLLEVAGADGRGRLWLTGDLVNRGPDSLGTLRWAMQAGDRVVTVLGNHDLHLLAVAAGVRCEHRSDTLAPILQAPDRDALIDWVRSRPLAWLEQGHLLVHAVSCRSGRRSRPSRSLLKCRRCCRAPTGSISFTRCTATNRRAGTTG
jgi:hypothetical protein